MTTLIIGAGLVGSQIARILVEDGERPVLMDRAHQVEALGEIVDLKRVVLAPSAPSCTLPPIPCSHWARSATRTPPCNSTSWGR
jgi:nucleoside-diphosphate-sugar epimerase